MRGRYSPLSACRTFFILMTVTVSKWHGDSSFCGLRGSGFTIQAMVAGGLEGESSLSWPQASIVWIQEGFSKVISLIWALEDSPVPRGPQALKWRGFALTLL